MVIAGAKGFAKEVLEILHQQGLSDRIAFFDDIDTHTEDLFDRFPILHSDDELKRYFETNNKTFTVGIGNPHLRKMFAERFSALGGLYTSTISTKADIGSFGVSIDAGANILDGARISNSVVIGTGALIYYNAVVTHDCIIGDFVEISPGATILGGVKVGHLSQIGAGAIILPGVSIGLSAVIGAGAVVTKDVQDGCTMAGIPARKLTKK